MKTKNPKRRSGTTAVSLCDTDRLGTYVAEMGSNHPFKSFQQIDLKSQKTYKSLDHDFRLLITLIHRC